MTTAREIMSPTVGWIDASMTIQQAALKMEDESFGMLPICDADGQLQGVVTDRDIVVKVVAQGRDPRSTRVSELEQPGDVFTIGANAPIEEAIESMKRHGVRRLPVVDGGALVGMLSQADIARSLPDARVGDLVASISSTAPNN